MTAIPTTLATVAAAAVLSIPAAAHAEGPCLPRDAVLHQLETEYGERPLWRGLGDDGRLLEIIGTGEGGTWTALVSLPPSAEQPRGLSCVVATGQAWKRPASTSPRESDT
jgi:hypothetical protein